MSIDVLLEIIRNRRSVRDFSGEDVTAAEVRALVEAAGQAPSNSNRQAWKFLAVKSGDVRARLRQAVVARMGELERSLTSPEERAGLEAYGRYLTFFADAPVLIIVLCKRSPAFLESLLRRAGVPPAEGSLPAEGFSAAMAVQNLLLAAHAMGLGACCVTGPLIAAGEFREILRVPSAYLFAALVPVGRPAGPTLAPPRKPVDEILEVIP
jgi:nitroreductase